MRIEHDPQNDSAYVYLDAIKEGEAISQVSVTPPAGQAEIILDFDREGRLLGLEVLGAGRALRPATLGAAGTA